MQSRRQQEGAALIMLLGIMAALSIIAVMLVSVIVNQQFTTARTRAKMQSFYADEAALDSGVRIAQVASPMPTSAPPSGSWISDAQLQAAFGAAFAPGAEVEYRLYDDLSTVDPAITWDSNANRRMWVEATATFKKRTTRARVLVQQMTVPFAAALPKAVTYSDTGIALLGGSDLYAVDADGTPINDGSHLTAISAGGTWTPTMGASRATVGRLTINASADLAGPGASRQSLGIRANGSVQIGSSVYGETRDAQNHQLPHPPAGAKFTDVTVYPGTVGYLSDYFDQAAQASLIDEAQAGGVPAAAPASWTYDPTTWQPITNNLRATIESAGYTAATDLYQTSSVNYGNLRLVSSSARTYSFRHLYVAGNLTIQGPITFSAASVYVGGKLTIQGPKNSTVTDSIGPIYCLGDINVIDRVNLECGTASVYGGGNITITGPKNSTTSATFGLIYASNQTKTLTFANNVVVKATGVTANGDFTIRGANVDLTDWLGSVYVAAYSNSATGAAYGDVDWSGNASVTSRDYTQQGAPSAPAAQPKPMWLGRSFTRTGKYRDEYGPIWVPGTSSLSVYFGSSLASSVMCPLLCTSEQIRVEGDVTFGSRTHPMVLFYVCDNNGIYPMVVYWKNRGTFYGLMIINESTIEFSGNTSSMTPTVEGAVFSGVPYDPTYTQNMSMNGITLRDSCSIAFNQAVVGAIETSSLKTTVTITETVPGSWQQLPVTD
jgi:Tfp pilus assembly protein PilX